MLRARLGRMMLSRTLMQLQSSGGGVASGGASGAAAAQMSSSSATASRSHLLLSAARPTALRQVVQQQPSQLHPLATVRQHLPSASSSSRRALHSSRVAAAAADVSADQQGVITETAMYTPEPAVYTADYAPEYANYHCVIGSIKNIKEHSIGESYWATFTVQVAPLVGMVDDYNCYIGGDPARMANAVLLARDVVKIMREGDQVQVGGAMILDGNRPKMFAHSIGKLEALAPGAVVQTLETPVLPEHVLAVAFSGPLPVVTDPPPAPRPAAALAPAAAAPRAGPINPPGMPAEPTFAKEAVWMSLFQENHLWIDQRTYKTGRQPDFKMRRAPEPGQQSPALWLDDNTPAWVQASLHLLPVQGPAVDPSTLPEYIPRSAAFSGYEVERHWVLLFTSYTDFWDNRVNKTNPRAPDFKLKEKEKDVALWIDSRGTPSWVQANLDKLPPPPPRAGATY